MGRVEKAKPAEVVIPAGEWTAAMFPGVRMDGGVRVKAYVDPGKAAEFAAWLDGANRR